MPKMKIMSIPKKKKSWVLKMMGLILGIIITASTIITIIILQTYPKLPSMDELSNYHPKLPLEVYSADGVLLGQFGQEHRIFIKYAQIPPFLIDAILAAEDERFFNHKGIDYIGLIRATIGNLITGHKQSGASTITMQVARNFFLTSQKTYTRKFNEILLAHKIETEFTKEQILELYINQIYLGQRSYGFAEASQTYFGKSLEQLSIAQDAVLAGLPKAPSTFNPVVNPDRSRERELYILIRMRDHQAITEEQYQIAVQQKIQVIKGTLHDSNDYGAYIAEMVRQVLYDKYGESIYSQGYKVYTTIDSHLQQDAYVALRNGLLKYDLSKGYRGAEAQIDLNISDDNSLATILNSFDNLVDYGNLLPAVVSFIDENNLTAILRDGSSINFTGQQFNMIRKYINTGAKNQIIKGSVLRVTKENQQWRIVQTPEVAGALIALNPQTGAIKALMGGFDFSYNSFNHATQALRQPGSSFKPFVYSAAIAHGFNANTIMNDNEICYPGSNQIPWCPRNDDDRFLGPISLRQALTLSRNTVTVQLLNAIGVRYAISYISRFGFAAAKFQPYLPMALGTNEATPLEMAQAYGVFATGGYLIDAYFIAKITDSKNNLIALTNPTNIKTQNPVIDPRNAYIMNNILQDVTRYGTGARAYKELQRNDIAGKTGTTTDAKDVWFDGYTPNLVTVVWMGYSNQPKSLGAHAYGASLALPIWIDFMKNALMGVEQINLLRPEGIIIESNSTWKNNNEYLIDHNYKNTNDDFLISESDVNAAQQYSTETLIKNDSSSPEANNDTESNSINPNKIGESAHYNASDTVPLDEIINNIQD